MTGFLGGLTTFSTFSVEVVTNLMGDATELGIRNNRRTPAREHRDDAIIASPAPGAPCSAGIPALRCPLDLWSRQSHQSGHGTRLASRRWPGSSSAPTSRSQNMQPSAGIGYTHRPLSRLHGAAVVDQRTKRTPCQQSGWLPQTGRVVSAMAGDDVLAGGAMDAEPYAIAPPEGGLDGGTLHESTVEPHEC